MNATMSLDVKHYPVMLNQILSILTPQHGGTFLDCTFGAGGYSSAILGYPNTKVVAIDRDKNVSSLAEQIKKKFPKRFKFINDKFSNLDQIKDLKIKPQGIIFDLGFSTHQMKDYTRGFSFDSPAPLDMRMGKNATSALDVINNFTEESLALIFKKLGEEKDSKKIAKEIVFKRKNNQIIYANDLAKIISQVKKNYFYSKTNPATKVFQALRMFVNKEVTELITGLVAATKLLEKNGKIIVVSFHSIEDRIIKKYFKTYSNLNPNPSRYVPSEKKNNSKPLFLLKSSSALIPSKDEIIKNRASRSAKMRFAIRNENNFFHPDLFFNDFRDYLSLEGLKL
tara:strand:- start:8388 stop:9404 length:1017 start_codon:yes stop_codon:yes gene_type:complete